MTEKALTTPLGILKLIPFAVVTAMIVLFWVDDFLGFILAIFYFWITLPAIVLSIVFFVMGLRWRDIWQRIAVVWGGLNLLMLILYFLVQAPNQRCNPDIMAKHYEEHHTEMEALHRYVQSAISDSCEITLEFKGKRLEMFHVRGSDGIYSTHWHNEARQQRDSLLTVVGLSQKEYENIRKQLKGMGCLGIEYSQFSPERLTIWFRRVGWGLYSYTILNCPMTDEEKASAMNGVAIPYNDHCYFNYDGGAVGPDSFSKEEREDFLKKHKPW